MTRRPCRGIRLVRAVSGVEVMTTVKANTDMSSPMNGSATPRPSLISGSRPVGSISMVMDRKTPAASMRRPGQGSRGARVRAVMVWDMRRFSGGVPRCGCVHRAGRLRAHVRAQGRALTADHEPVYPTHYSGRMTTDVAPSHLFHWVVTLACTDGPGIVHAVSGAIVAARGNITESQQFASLDTGRFFMRVQVESPAGRAEFEEALAPVVERWDMTWHLDEVGRPLRTLVLASTAGHCVNDLLFRQHAGQLPVEIPLVLSNHGTLRDLVDFYGVPFESLAVTDAASKAAFEQRVLAAVDEHDVELVVLARYMQILTPELCDALAGRCINIHHSFLPGFKGANPYRQAHARGREAHRRHGALRHERPRRGPDHRAERRARRPLARGRRARRDRAGRGEPHPVAGREVVRGAPRAARRGAHDHLPLIGR